MRTALATMLVLFTAAAHAAYPPASVADLVRALQHKDGTKRLHAAAALGELGTTAKAALPALTKALDDPHRLVRFYAAEAIGKVGGTATSELKRRLIKVVKADESWIVARQAALTLERLEPKGLWAHAILLQRPGEDSAHRVVKSTSTRQFSAKSMGYAVHLLGAPDSHRVLSALYYLNVLRSQNVTTRRYGALRIVPVMFHSAKQVRTASRQFLSQMGFDGAKAAQLAELSTDAGNEAKIEKLVREPHTAGGLMELTTQYVSAHSGKFPSNVYAVTLVTTFRKHVRQFKSQLPDMGPLPFAPLTAYIRTGDVVYLDLAATRESHKYWLEQLRTRDRKQLVRTLNVLAMPEVRVPSLIAELAKLVGDSRDGVSDGAIRALLTNQPGWQSISVTASKLLNSKDASLRLRAVRLLLSLQSMRKDALPALRDAIAREPVAEIRQRILYGFGEWKADDAATVDVLANIVARDSDAELRTIAARMIAAFGRKASGAVKPLFAALETEKNPAVKLQIALALERCVKPQSRTRETLRKLIVEYSRQVALAALRDVIRRQEALAKETAEQNLRDVLGLQSKP